ncbi:MAG: C39 family peptidase [Endomicrobium sp.]|jgi:ABC-type bacteriocin/lantibiotic exporter with double-glycine peptidase domain|nr:C39 family peptidase [Endomicrobium sp.]
MKPTSIGIADFYKLKNKSDKNFVFLKNFKGYQQTTNYTCGIAAVMSVLHYYGKLKKRQLNHKTELKLAKEMHTSKKHGTTPQQISGWLKSAGFKVKNAKNGNLRTLRANIKKGIPVIVEWIDWGGHWAVLCGYHKRFQKNKRIVETLFLADPAVQWYSTNNPDGISSVSSLRFKFMWFDAQHFSPGKLIRNIYITVEKKD